VVAETDDYVAIASEFRSLAHLPGVKHATCSNPRPRRCTYGTPDLRPGRTAPAGAQPFLHTGAKEGKVGHVTVLNPDGAHNIAVGLNCPVEVDVVGHAGYYAAGMNKHATVTITGSAGTGVAENMMSGKVHVKGFASNGAGASAHGGLLVIEGDAGLRCGISLKGGDIVVGGSVGSFSGLHGAGRPHGDLRRCRRRARRFALRGRALREGQGQVARRRRAVSSR
jgi:hypothetical protein